MKNDIIRINNRRLTKKIIKILISILLCCTCIMDGNRIFAASASDLRYSTYSSTPSNYASINCYGFALGKSVAVDPGYYSSKKYYDNSTSFGECVAADLRALGYGVRYVSSPDATLKSNEVLIAYYYGIWRTKPLANGDYGEMRAYHFWKRDHTNSPWYHKYGRQSGIMKFNYSPISANNQYVSDEYYNGITGVLCLPGYYAVSGQWGYLAFDYYKDGPSPVSIEEEDPDVISGKYDHSAAALIEQNKN